MRKFGRPDEDFGLWDYNPYYSPEACGLELLATIQEPNMWYEFNMAIVVRDIETGSLFAAADSGCSCPTPFEDIEGLDDMTLIRTIDDFDSFFEDKRGLQYIDIVNVRKNVERIL